ncbi:reverse transcriptase/maturase family protein [Flavobacterium sp. B183]|uniref:reverse transcriptase/maturase family protein n=1 Tax=Flavobacterium sp. B183 TaxID=907046 RepID=UPI00201EFE46|nr:reverse transcriptase/maturase family protein [Flavobacterium sp. B183]URC12472.1 reverse transcriptase/maturase family protein [Flavobacterium sp. B183]
MNKATNIPEWLKTKGYLHLSPSLTIDNDWLRIKKQIENKEFISKYAFYPLIHSFIKERKYKKSDPQKHSTSGRAHKHINSKNGASEKSEKLRPLHYASHFDSLIYGYYSSLLNEQYEKKLEESKKLFNSITAYRKLKIDTKSNKGKGTIHFAKEVFDEIKKRSQYQKVAVLTFDIKGFFSSLDHQILKERWAYILNEEKLPKDHYNVFKSCTNFRYVLKDDLRTRRKKNGRKSEFDERKLSKIRREKGFKCFFESNADFRKHIKEGKLRIYDNPFRKTDIDNKKSMIGIPQGLPISAVLANIYLYDFDKAIIENLVEQKNNYYRRYSDDIILICNVEDIKNVKTYIEDLIKESKLEISTTKTETFVFDFLSYNSSNDTRLTSIRINNDGSQSINSPLIYLGFEFRGFNVVVKSTNLAKFYRRLISIIKRRAKRSIKGIEKDPNQKKAIYLNQIKKLYTSPLREIDSENNDLKQKERKKSFLQLNKKGEYTLISKKVLSKKRNSNYVSYIKRCCEIFEDNSFKNQIRKSKHVVYTAIKKHLN